MLRHVATSHRRLDRCHRACAMIICHCTQITDREIHAAITWMRASDADTIITPGKIYRALGKKADCGGCLSLFVDTMMQAPGLEVPANLRGLRKRNKERNFG